MTQYQLFIKSACPSPPSATSLQLFLYDSVKLRASFTKMCQGLGITFCEASIPLFQEKQPRSRRPWRSDAKEPFFGQITRLHSGDTQPTRFPGPPRHAIRFRPWRYTDRLCLAQAG